MFCYRFLVHELILLLVIGMHEDIKFNEMTPNARILLSLYCLFWWWKEYLIFPNHVLFYKTLVLHNVTFKKFQSLISNSCD